MRHLFSDVRPFRRDSLAFFLEKAREDGGPAVRLALGPKRTWLITDPTLARALLKNDERTVDKGYFVKKLRPIVGESMLTINGEENVRRRQALHAVFSKGIAEQYVPELSGVIREAIGTLVGRGRFTVLDLTSHLTLRMICAVMFGKSVLSPSDESLIVGAVRLVESDVAAELFRPFPALPWERYAQRARRKAALSMMQVVVERVRHRASGSSVLSALLALGLDDQAIRDEIVTLLIAGHHTTGAAAAWILYYLALHPQLARGIAREAALCADGAGEATVDGLPRASLSVAMVKEVLRLFPSAHWFSRDARTTIETASGTIRPGDSLIFCLWQLHRDERYWTNPETFDVTRSFSTPAYLPFGAGPRACIGMRLASVNLQLIAIEFASAFELKFAGQPPRPWPQGSVTLVPPPMELQAEVRRSIDVPLAAE